jgi:hypothetical protein
VTEILVEVRPDPQRAENLSGDKLTERFAARVDEMGATLGDIANGLRDQLERRLSDERTSAWQLDELQLSFKFDLQAEAGIVLARASTTAGFEASLTWKRPTPPAPQSES